MHAARAISVTGIWGGNAACLKIVDYLLDRRLADGAGAIISLLRKC
jgi:hypothetical protein